MSPKKVALWFLIGSVAVSALLGIIAILSSSFGDFEVRIIMTTLTISAASIGALASGALWESRNTKLLPTAGVSLSIIAATMIIIGIWVNPRSQQFWKLTGSISVLAVATAHACLLSMARLAPRFKWARVTAFVAVYFLAACIIYLIYFQPRGDFGARVMGVTAIVAAALSIMTPIFHRLSRADFVATTDKAAWARQRSPTITCPRCGASQANSPFAIRCGTCGCRFVVNILEEESPQPAQL